MIIPISDEAVSSEMLRAWRKEMGMTQLQAAQKLGVAHRTYRYWESDTDPRRPEHPKIIRLALRALAADRRAA